MNVRQLTEKLIESRPNYMIVFDFAVVVVVVPTAAIVCVSFIFPFLKNFFHFPSFRSWMQTLEKKQQHILRLQRIA